MFNILIVCLKIDTKHTDYQLLIVHFRNYKYNKTFWITLNQIQYKTYNNTDVTNYFSEDFIKSYIHKLITLSTIISVSCWYQNVLNNFDIDYHQSNINRGMWKSNAYNGVEFNFEQTTFSCPVTKSLNINSTSLILLYQLTVVGLNLE